ncbi:hypothetical protein ACHAW6_000844 [Cyclotella cf. meneghiniana]
MRHHILQPDRPISTAITIGQQVHNDCVAPYWSSLLKTVPMPAHPRLLHINALPQMSRSHSA